MKVIDVKATDDYKINVVFEDGTSGTVNLSDLIQKGIFQPLKDKSIFQKVYTTGSAIAWSEELEIDADNIYAEILNRDPASLLHTPTFHAAD